MNRDEMLEIMKKYKASDLHITSGSPPVMRVNGKMIRIGEKILLPKDTEIIIQSLFPSEAVKEKFERFGEVDFAISRSGIGRYRINVFKQRGSYTAAIRALPIEIPSIESLGLPSEIVTRLVDYKKGLILVTGATGSGKTTTLAAMIDYINCIKYYHILTLEDPIEYRHKHKNSIVNQREIGTDSRSYNEALRAALRQNPDVILIGEMRDTKTIEIALQAAETGHLVLSTLHTVGAAESIDRIIDAFPIDGQNQIRMQLSKVLKGVISQQLVPSSYTNDRCVAVETMITNAAICNLIREGKSHQIYSQIQTGNRYGMKTMNQSLLELYQLDKISLKTAKEYTEIPDELDMLLKSRA